MVIEVTDAYLHHAVGFADFSSQNFGSTSTCSEIKEGICDTLYMQYSGIATNA
jgi:hypothetical protein